MSRLMWLLFLLGAYLWIVTSGKEETLIKYGKVVYEAVVEWLDGADMDFQLKEKKTSKRDRRWS